MDWMLMPIRRYADFSGRSRRKEYWMFALGYILAALVWGVLLGIAGGFSEAAIGGGLSAGVTILLVVGVMALLALIVPSLAVTVRRFHDQDKSGWFVLLNFIPYVGGIVVFVFMLLPGTVGPNRFGADPKAGEQAGMRPVF